MFNLSKVKVTGAGSSGRCGYTPPSLPRKSKGEADALLAELCALITGMARLLRNSRMFQLCRIIRAYRIFLLVLLLPGGARSDLGRIQELMQGMSTGAKNSVRGNEGLPLERRKGA